MDLRIEFAPADDTSLDPLLAERLYEFNAAAIGCFDGRALAAAIRDDAGAIVAGISGHTWAGCGQVTHLWVHAAWRGRGFGGRLLAAAEAEARLRGCTRMLLSSHSFQAPGFYERLGYARQAVVADHPVGHTNIWYAKRL